MTKPIPQGYKQTKVGIIPEDWDVVGLNDGVHFLDHKRKPLKDEDRQRIQGQYPYYGASGIIDYVNDYIFDEELILLGEDGANIIDRSSRLVFIAKGRYWVNNHAHVLKPKQIFNNYFLCEYLESLKYDKYNTGTAQPKLNKEIVSKIPIIKPPLKEQEKIAEILTTWDDAIAKQEQLIEQKQVFKKGIMQQIFSQKIRFKDDKGNDYPAWKEKRLGDIVDNYGGTSLEQYVDLDGKYKFISIGNYSKTGHYIDNAQRINANEKSSSKILDAYDLVMVLNDKTSTGDIIGSTILISEDNKFIYNQRSERLVCKHTVFPKFLWFYLNSAEFRSMVFSIAQGGTQIYVNFPAVKRLNLDLPNLEEQTKIADFLTSLDDEITKQTEILDQLKLQKQSLMQKLLTGQVRVKL